MKTVAIFGVPRSGTSWLGQIFNSSPKVAYRYQPLFSFAFKNYLDLNSKSEEIESFYLELLKSQDPFLLQIKNVSGNVEDMFPKEKLTHLVWKEVRYLHLIEHLILNSDIKIIGIVRSPFAVMHSWFSADREFNINWNKDEELLLAQSKNQGRPEEFYGLKKWVETYLSFHEFVIKYSERFKLVYYEKLLEDTEIEVERLFSFVNLTLTSQTKDFIIKSKALNTSDPYGVYKIKSIDENWSEKLDVSILDTIKQELKLNQIEYEPS